MENHVKEKRMALGMTLREVSKASGVPISTLSDIERGSEPMLSTARRIAIALNASLEELWS